MTQVPEQSSSPEALGSLVRSAREQADMPITELADLSGIPKGTLSKLENGQVTSPRPATLSALAGALHLPMADLYAAAGYERPSTLPSLPVYLRSRYHYLPPEAQAELSEQVAQIARKHGFDPAGAGPAPGEDET